MAAISDQDSRRPVEFAAQGEKAKASRKRRRAAGSRGAAAHRKDGRVAWLFMVFGRKIVNSIGFTGIK